MSVEIRVPQLPESVADATLAVWHKQIGQPVRRDENLGDLETDKVMLEIPAPVSGVLREIKVQPGTSVKSGTVLALIEEGAGAAATAVDSGAGAPPAPTAAAPVSARPTPAAAPVAAGPLAAAPAGAASATPAAPAVRPAAATPAVPTAAPPRTGPAARRVLDESKLSASGVAAGAARLNKTDALAAVARTQAAAAAPSAEPTPSASAAMPSAPQPPVVPLRAPIPTPAPAARAEPAPPAGARSEQRVPMSRLRARIAERLLQAQTTQALLTTFNEVDLAAAQALRRRYKEAFERQYGAKLGWMSFFVKAVVEALKRFPIINAAVDGSDIVYHGYFDIGVAVATDRGLMVPVLRDADALSFADIERQIAEYANRAREGSIRLEELTGGTFSITNGGIFGSLMSTPIVNTPQSAILGMHKIQERPVVVDGQIAVRPLMYLALTYDHRIIDGREAVQFLVTVKDCLEDPGRLLLGI